MNKIYITILIGLTACVSTQIKNNPQYLAKLDSNDTILFSKIEGMSELSSLNFYFEFNEKFVPCSTTKYIPDEAYVLKQWAIPLPSYSQIDTSYFDEIAKYSKANYLLTMKVLNESDGGTYDFNLKNIADSPYLKDELISSSKLGFVLFSLTDKIVVYDFTIEGKTESFGIPNNDGGRHNINLASTSRARSVSFKKGLKKLYKDVRCK